MNFITGMHELHFVELKILVEPGCSKVCRAVDRTEGTDRAPLAAAMRSERARMLALEGDTVHLLWALNLLRFYHFQIGHSPL